MKVLLLLAFVVGVCRAHWSYNDISAWTKNYPTCAGTSQSPINLTPSESTCGVGTGRAKTYLKGYVQGTAENNGHYIEITVPGDGLMINIGGEVFNILQFHFHWGRTNNVGSEHTVDGKPYPMEMHVVASRKGGAQLAVLGFFYTIGSSTNEYLQPVVEALPLLYYPGSSEQIEVDLAALVAPSINGNFYRYHGSLTTPPCSEIVTWSVYQIPLELSQKQLDAFRNTSIKGNNFRPTQPLNGRAVYDSAC